MGYCKSTPPVNLDRSNCVRNYEQHVCFLKKELENTGKLLVLEDINCGWEVICGFCGVEVPVGLDWPHKNKNAKINEELFGQGSELSVKMKREMMKRLIYRFFSNKNVAKRVENS